MKGFRDRKRQGMGEWFMGEKCISDRRGQLQTTRFTFILQQEGEAPGEF